MSSVAVLKLGTRSILPTEILETLVRCQLLPTLCREIIIDTEIASLTCPPELTEPAIAQFYEQHGVSDDQRSSWQQQQHLNDVQVEQIATRGLRIELFKRQSWGHRLEAHFMGRKAELDQVVYSLLRTSDPEVAQELYFRIKAGEATFADVAAQYSQGSEAETGGQVGPVSLSQLHPALAEKLMQAQPQQLLPPTRMGEWFVLLRLEQWLPVRLDEAMRQQLLDELFQDWLDQQLAGLNPHFVVPTPVSV